MMMAVFVCGPGAGRKGWNPEKPVALPASRPAISPALPSILASGFALPTPSMDVYRPYGPGLSLDRLPGSSSPFPGERCRGE